VDQKNTVARNKGARESLTASPRIARQPPLLLERLDADLIPFQGNELCVACLSPEVLDGTTAFSQGLKTQQGQQSPHTHTTHRTLFNSVHLGHHS